MMEIFALLFNEFSSTSKIGKKCQQKKNFLSERRYLGRYFYHVSTAVDLVLVVL